MHDLKSLHTEPCRDLGCAHKLIHIDTAAHSRILTHSAYMLTHPQLPLAANAARGRKPGSELGKLLADYEPPPLDEAVDEALLDFMARRKGAMPDIWV